MEKDIFGDIEIYPWEMELNHIPGIFPLWNKELQFVYDRADDVDDDKNHNN